MFSPSTPPSTPPSTSISRSRSQASTPSTPSTPTPIEALACRVCTLSEIIAQLSDENDEVRFQCLAYARRGNSARYYRCPWSSRDFETSHPDLYQQATEVMSKVRATSFEYSWFVMRIFFCETHHKKQKFQKYYDGIEAHWNGDGNGEVEELLNAIRHVRNFQLSIHPAPTVTMSPSLPHRFRKSFGMESAASATSPQPPLTAQNNRIPIATTETSGHTQSLPNLGLIPETTIEPKSSTPFPPSVQTRHTRSRSTPSTSSNEPQHTRGSGDQQLYGGSQGSSLQNAPSQIRLASTLQSPVAGLSGVIPAPGSSVESPFLDAPTHTSSNGHARRRSNPPQPSFVVADAQVTATQPGHEASATSTKTMEVLISSTAPQRTSLDFSFPIPNAQLSLLSPSTSTPNGSTLSAAALILEASGITNTPRPSVNGQPEAATGPALTSSTPHMLDSDVPRDVVARTDTVSEMTAISVPASFSPTSWDGFYKEPVGAGNPRLGPQKIPQRQRSKDDTCLDQLARSLAAVTPPLSNPNTERQIPAPESTNKVYRPNTPLFIDYAVRREIMDGVDKEGHVYILKAPEYFQQNFPEGPPMLKIGKSADIPGRINSLRTSCGLLDLARVEDPEDRPLKLYWKIERLVHAELRNFNQILKCTKCRGKKGSETEHTEWFAVTEEVALRTVQRWRRFIQQEPYGDNGILKEFWSWKIISDNLPKPKNEKWDDSKNRDERWTKWLEDGENRSNKA
ncbi:uncharacterized protein BP5553_06617 [Venustampulla echinocandica]|uniref:Bacteriophage T5 Orf172 DNA-binding domain-containing protein n=1 Tax=Venustampulla echinocandica TaxID=2656787 RepID=A0A370TKG3_9HELO|nr:uncharacterized protein BP5553_06617 [Venustampulla echinocandica]RDL36005.1 hypothetical protein BP5553_06617 [Venustampulla echinocandica]